MKRLLTLIFSFCLLFSPTITTEAKSPDIFSSTYVEYIGDNLYAEIELSITTENPNLLSVKASAYQKTATKTCTIKNNSGKAIATYTLTGTFVYNGSSSACTKATYSSSITDPLYSFISRTARCSGNSAIGNFTILSSVQTISKTVTLKCSPNGTIQ